MQGESGQLWKMPFPGLGLSRAEMKYIFFTLNIASVTYGETYQAISIDARKGVWVNAIFSDKNSFKTLFVMGFCRKDIQIQTN